MTEVKEINLSEAGRHFILYWGDMGGQWGVNRSVAQIHALLYLSSRPVNAEEIQGSLGIARSNVSNSLKELVGWKLIRRVPVRGDRREHFEAECDVWEMAMRIAQGRKEREIDPAADALKLCVEKAKDEKGIDPLVLERLQDMQAFVEDGTRWYNQMLTVPKNQLMTLIRMGDKVLSFIKFTARKSE
ncbi:MAG: MarR family transcriptional regulator [Pseudomonadota bacterium]